MRTKRFKMQIENANCKFWLMVFENEKKLNAYVERVCKTPTPADVGSACCLANKGNRDILVCITANRVSTFIIVHEAFHAATWYTKLNRRRFTKRKWMNILEGWHENEPLEEDLADICGSVASEIWRLLKKHFVMDAK